MSPEASGGGASVGNSDRNGGNNVGHECSIGMDQIIEESSGQRFNEEEKKIEESSDQIEESSDQRFNEEEKEKFDSFDKALEAVKAVNKTGRAVGANPKIQKVPSMLRNNNKFENYFLPKVFSFGPCSVYQDSSTEEMADQIKYNLVAKFLQLNDVKKEDLYGDIKNQIQRLRNCYNDSTYYNDHELAWMFLVDGCAILQFMYSSANFWENLDSSFVTLGINTNYEVFLEQDLFLLENQLPYQLLQLIIQHASKQQKTADDSTSKEEKLLKSIYKFIFHCFRTPEEWYENKYEILADLKEDHVHLLDLLRKKLIQPLYQKSEKHDHIENIIRWTVDLFDKLKCTRNESDGDRFPVPHRNIRKLREAGINLKPSNTSCLGDISFSGGTLKLPPIIVDESTTRMLLNMLGYEMCPDFQDRSEVSNYIYFLDKLIDRTQDVEELRENNILRNELGSDEEVVNLFNQIGPHLLPDFEYSEVKRNIDNYFDNKGLIWLHKISHDIHQYFKRRWSLLAFIGALLAVISTIFQSVFTFLAYQADSKKGI